MLILAMSQKKYIRKRSPAISVRQKKNATSILDIRSCRGVNCDSISNNQESIKNEVQPQKT